MRDRLPGDAVGEPVKKLRQAGNADDNQEVAKKVIAQAQRLLLHAGIEPGGQSDVSDLNQDDAKLARVVRARHGNEVDTGANRGGHESALPVPATAQGR